MFLGRGWGHGVGLCQNGAFGMALAGATYDQILRQYYTGIEIVPLDHGPGRPSLDPLSRRRAVLECCP